MELCNQAIAGPTPAEGKSTTCRTTAVGGAGRVPCMPESENTPTVKYPLTGGSNLDFLRLACHAAGLGLWRYHVPSGQVYWSPELELLVGLKPGSFEGTIEAVRRCYPPEDRVRVPKLFQELAAEHRTEFAHEHQLLHTDGSVRWVEVRGELQYDAKGNLEWLIGAVLDITERKQADTALRRVIANAAQTGRAFFETMVKTLAACLEVRYAYICELDPTLPPSAVSLAVWANGKPGAPVRYVLAGTPCEHVVNQGLRYYPADIQTLFPEDQSLARMGAHSYLGVPLFNTAGAPIGHLCVMHDQPLKQNLQPDVLLKIVADRAAAEIERYRSEQRLQATRAELSAIVEITPNVAIQIYDAQARIQSWNPASARMFGFSGQEAIGKTLDQLIHSPEEARGFRELLEAINRDRQPVGPAEYPFKRKDGSHGWCLSTTFAVHAPGGEPRFACMDVDITERKLAEQALRDSEQRYRTLVENAPEALVVLDVDTGGMDAVNPVAERLFGWSREELLKMHPADFSPPTQPDGRPSLDAAREYIQRAVEGELPVFPWTHRNRRGEDFPCEVRLVRLPATGRTLVRGSVTDITERVRMEEQLREVQKLESIGRLAGGIAHDFNNLLTSIIGYTELAQKDADDEVTRRHLEVVALAATRGAELTSQLLAFARRQVISPRNVSLNNTLVDAERLLRRVIGEHIVLETIPHVAMPMARVDPGQLSQVVINLAINARDAMPQGGRLTLETGFADIDDAYAQKVGDLATGRYVTLTVSDTGRGITPELQRRIFEPFFTTKNPGQGTGLGLATCYGIIKQHKGHLAVYSEIGKGTTFKVYLPPADRNWPDELKPPPTAHGGGAESILVCEDDPMLCDLTREILLGAGYTVFAAETAQDLLKHVAAHPAPFQLLITDLVMPDLSGPELAARMRELRPGIEVLFVSGYTENSALHNGHLEKGMHFLQKPFSLNDLTRTVRTILDAVAAR